MQNIESILVEDDGALATNEWLQWAFAAARAPQATAPSRPRSVPRRPAARATYWWLLAATLFAFALG
jgi:hypothetical protein